MLPIMTPKAAILRDAVVDPALRIENTIMQARQRGMTAAMARVGITQTLSAASNPISIRESAAQNRQVCVVTATTSPDRARTRRSRFADVSADNSLPARESWRRSSEARAAAAKARMRIAWSAMGPAGARPLQNTRARIMSMRGTTMITSVATIARRTIAIRRMRTALPSDPADSGNAGVMSSTLTAWS
jgi:hypothetical protein